MDSNSSNGKIQKNKKNLPNKPIVPITYPDHIAEKSRIPISSDSNVEYAKEWVDFNIK